MFDRNSVPTAVAKVVGVCGRRMRPWGSPVDGRRGDQQGERRRRGRGRAREGDREGERRESRGGPVRPTGINSQPNLFPSRGEYLTYKLSHTLGKRIKP